MSRFRSRLVSFHERTVTNVATVAAAGAVAGVTTEVAEPLLHETAEIRRILGDQGDAADEIAEAIGRTLTRLSGEVAALAAEVERLRKRLDQTDHLAVS